MPSVTMGEGTTPLIEASRIGDWAGSTSVLFKLDHCNPTGSYKDRFVAAEMRRLVAAGVRAAVATSSGNTGSSLAAYSARNGIACTIIVSTATPSGKLLQMRAHGARVLRVEDFIVSPDVTRSVMDTLSRLALEKGIAMVVSAYRYCPEGMAGVESVSREILLQTQGNIGHVFVPVGGGGLYAAVVRGLRGTAVKAHIVQPSGCPTILNALTRGDGRIDPVTVTTRISGLGVPYDIDAGLALSLMRECGGSAIGVSDEEVWEAQRAMLALEGIYAEPAGAAALAGLKKAVRTGIIGPHERAVCLVTGQGSKDPDSIAEAAKAWPDAIIAATDLEAQFA